MSRIGKGPAVLRVAWLRLLGGERSVVVDGRTFSSVRAIERALCDRDPNEAAASIGTRHVKTSEVFL